MSKSVQAQDNVPSNRKKNLSIITGEGGGQVEGTPRTATEKSNQKAGQLALGLYILASGVIGGLAADGAVMAEKALNILPANFLSSIPIAIDTLKINPVGALVPIVIGLVTAILSFKMIAPSRH